MREINRPEIFPSDIFTNIDQMSPATESYKMIRTNIEFSAIDSNLRTINITSSGQGEGKSTVLANLAMSFAQIGRRVLLIDADLRRPHLQRLFGLSNRRGLTNALISHELLSSFFLPTQMENLSVLTSGPIPPNPAELIMSESMAKLLETAKVDYDMIFIDCPPVGIITDAAIMATKVDGTIFVVRAGDTDKRLLKRAAEHLAQVDAHVLGYIFNGVDQKSDEYYYQRQYYMETQPKQSRFKKNKKGSIPNQVRKYPSKIDPKKIL